MTSTPNTGYLIEDQWDDWFQYSTMYDLYIVDSLSHQCYMGKTKIGQKGMVEDQRRPALPESFSRLSEDFFSLGQDSYYYENIKNLGDVMRSEILAALNDIAYNTKLIRTAQKEPVTKKSLLRSVPLTTVKEQFNRIALGGARLTPYNFVSLVISPTNLIPTCANCNKNKADVVVHKKEDAILNPYYEDLDSLIWLSAEIVKDIASNFLTMTFSVLPPNDCDPVLCARLKNQFAVLHLNDLYSKHAAEEMIAVFNRHSRIYKVAGTIGVKESILESLEENKYRPNSWQSAMYRALNDEWYLTKWLPQKYSENI